jgi:hypothetical protein
MCVMFGGTDLCEQLFTLVKGKKCSETTRLTDINKEKSFNPLKTKRICFISAYRAVDTLYFGYKNQSLNVL